MLWVRTISEKWPIKTYCGFPVCCGPRMPWTVRAAAERWAAVFPIAMWHRESGFPVRRLFGKKRLNEQLQQLYFARELGLTTAVGTGAGSIGILHGESVAEEMKLFIKAGYTREEAIRCASGNGARFFGMETLGTLTVGRPATFLLTRGTVQQLPRKLSYLEGIYINGTPSTIYHKNP